MDCNEDIEVPNDLAMEPELDLQQDSVMRAEYSEAVNTMEKAPSKSKRPYDDPDALEMEPQKKLCRFYYLDQCMKAESCCFMHSDFPCKFYYFGYECKDGKNCKLRHGPALDLDMKQALWDHVMSAPANLLQRFPCFPHILLKQNFDDRHHELIQMEQEGLLEDNETCIEKENGFNPISSTLLSEVIKTVSKAQMPGDALAKLGELVDILTPEQIASLASIGVETMEQLFQLGASTLLKLGFDFETLITISNFKEAQRKKSIYNIEINEDHVMDNTDIFGSEVLDVSLSSTVDQPALTDQELLNILNDDLNTSSASVQGVNASMTYADFAPKESKANGDGFPDGLNNQNDNNGIPKETSAGNDDNNQTIGCALKAFSSDAGSECKQLMLYPSVKEKENDKKSLDSIQRTVAQLKKIDSLLTEEKEQDISWGSEESDTSADHPRLDSSVTDSVNQSFGSDSDSQTCFRMPFKSIMNRYTPATEIDASNVKFGNAQYKLITVDIPTPNFERIRRSFVTAPTYSLDPRIQIMFNVSQTEVRHVDRSKAAIRDPRLKKQTEAQIVDSDNIV